MVGEVVVVIVYIVFVEVYCDVVDVVVYLFV